MEKSKFILNHVIYWLIYLSAIKFWSYEVSKPYLLYITIFVTLTNFLSIAAANLKVELVHLVPIITI